MCGGEGEGGAQAVRSRQSAVCTPAPSPCWKATSLTKPPASTSAAYACVRAHSWNARQGSVQGTVQGGRPECCPGVGVGTGVGVAISRSRRDLAAAHVSQIELAPAAYDVVELVARLLAKVRAGAGVDGGVEGSSTRQQGPCCRAVLQGRAARGACTDSRVSSWP